MQVNKGLLQQLTMCKDKKYYTHLTLGILDNFLYNLTINKPMNNCDCKETRCEPAVDYCCEKLCVDNVPSATTAIMGHERAREVSIEQLDYGYKISVDCQTFAIESLETVLDMLGNYLKSPNSVEEMWRKGELKFYNNIK